VLLKGLSIPCTYRSVRYLVLCTKTILSVFSTVCLTLLLKVWGYQYKIIVSLKEAVLSHPSYCFTTVVDQCTLVFHCLFSVQSVCLTNERGIA
jgi:hypothetical protein